MDTIINFRRRGLGYGAAAFVALAVTALAVFDLPGQTAQAADPAPAPAATPVSVAVVEARQTKSWEEFSGRLEAIERVDVRSRVAGAVLATHFREGALVKQGDLLITIDPDPYSAEVERAKAQVAAAEARVALTRLELARGQKLVDSRVASVSELDQRTNAHNEASANLRAAQAAQRAAQLNLDYTGIRAPVSGRVGKLEVTIGNLVAAGPSAPVLTTLVSVDPIYASFNADEAAVARALAALPAANGLAELERIPVEIVTATQTGDPARGALHFVDNQVEPTSGTVRMRAVFRNSEGALMPGQFARVHLGQAKAEQALAISERAIGTDQDKKFVMVVDAENKAVYRQVRVGGTTEGLRIVTDGLTAGERIVVNGLQRIRPGALVAPQNVAMDGRAVTQNPAGTTEVAAR